MAMATPILTNTIIPPDCSYRHWVYPNKSTSLLSKASLANPNESSPAHRPCLTSFQNRTRLNSTSSVPVSRPTASKSWKKSPLWGTNNSAPPAAKNAVASPILTIPSTGLPYLPNQAGPTCRAGFDLNQRLSEKSTSRWPLALSSDYSNVNQACNHQEHDSKRNTS